jgi:hypothetical protein
MEQKERNLLDPMVLRKAVERLGNNPYRKFNIAFSLMSVIPLLTFFYILIGKLFTIDILSTNIGAMLFIVIIISLCGYYVGYTVIRTFLNNVVSYVVEVSEYNEQLKSKLIDSFGSMAIKA